MTQSLYSGLYAVGGQNELARSAISAASYSTCLMTNIQNFNFLKIGFNDFYLTLLKTKQNNKNVLVAIFPKCWFVYFFIKTIKKIGHGAEFEKKQNIWNFQNLFSVLK